MALYDGYTIIRRTACRILLHDKCLKKCPQRPTSHRIDKELKVQMEITPSAF